MTDAEKKKGGAGWFQRLLDGRWSHIVVPVFCVLLSLLVSGVLLVILGKNPFVGFYSFLQGSGLAPKGSYGGGSGIQSDFFTFLGYLAPMLLASLGFVVGFRAGLFNIGISGQMVASAFTATVLVGYSDLPAVLSKPLVIIIGAVVGALLGALVGFLKYRFNVHEVVSTIMINYILNYIVGFFINMYFVNGLTRSSLPCSTDATLMIYNVQIGGINCTIPLGIFLAVALAFFLDWLFKRTVVGFELKAVGQNPKAAKYAGINVGKRLIQAMALSGALAGLAGVAYYCGYYTTIVPKTLPQMGYDCIAVALLGNGNPIGSIFASILVSVFQNGSNFMSSTLGVQKEIASLIVGIMLLFSACGGYFRFLAHRKVQRAEDAKIEAKAKAEAAAEGMTGEGEK